MTALIHPQTSQPWAWRLFLREEPRSWPVETGGDETLREVLSLSERKMQDGGGVADGIEEKLVSLLLPERRRLHEATKDARRSMLSVAHD